MIGELVGNFRITGQLGQGGMGEVWLAEHKEIKTKVAIKMLLPNISADQQMIDRFFNEAVAVSKIKHAGIARIFDVGFHKGRAYLVMEFLDGEPLASRIERTGRLSVGAIADIARQIAGVLEATHVEGITHRDLKPDNIFLVRDTELDSGERVKILDFGIAKLNTTGMTSTSAGAMGTPSYMSPEQWRSSAKVDGRADAYSLGCVIFEMACGRPPFLADSIGEAYHAHTTLPPPLIRSIVGTMPEALDGLVARLLSKDPIARPTMAETKATLAALAQGQPPAAAPAAQRTELARPRAAPVARSWAGRVPDTTLGHGAGSTDVPPERRSRAAWLIAMGGVAVGGAIAAWAVLHTPSHTDPVVAPVTPPPAPPPVAPPVAIASNPFVPIAPPPHVVELGLSATAPEHERGFRPERHVVAPMVPYSIQAHEVTWTEVSPWLAANESAIEDAQDRAIARALAAHAKVENLPRWVVDPMHDARVPASGLTWSTALQYCKSLDALLPTEEQWEYAARGPELRPNAWGAARIDLVLTRAYRGDGATPAAIESSDQDLTPDRTLRDLAGNVQEWTFDLWREDRPGQDERWVADPKTQTSFRAIRGLPLAATPPAEIPQESAAYREPLCATGICIERSRKALAYVGFRCAKLSR